MTPEEQAAMDVAQEKQIRELAAQITQMSKLGFDPLTIRKGIVASVNDATSPPTVSINISGDTSTLVAQVRTLNNYTPLVGQTVLVAKQGTEIFLLGSIASVNPTGTTTTMASTSGWIKATLTNGTHGANGNGDIYYRRVMDHGSWKMQWRGGWGPAGATAMIDTANALDPDYRPSSTRSVVAARNQVGANAVYFNFLANGEVDMIGGTTAPTLDINESSPGTSSNGSHAHGYFDDWDGLGSGSNDSTGSEGTHSHTVNSHFHGGSTTVAAPTFVSLNGIEYFL